ncbi:MAG: NADH-quinone oxidoreductase subunit NuoN [Azospirillaceae bacterium]|nr:NADH-quinone oxidoreductase subunit NuoN [Azospirillaceae bacterium]
MNAPFPALSPALPEIFLVLCGFALLLYGVFRGDRSTRSVGYLAVLALVITARLVIGGADGRAVTFEGLYVVDSFARFMKVLVLLGSAFSILIARGYLERENMKRPEFAVLIVLATFGMLMMISANDLISLYVGLETQSLALYVVAAMRRDNAKSSEAGLKYFLLGALSSGMLLYGASLVYGFSGTTNFDGVARLLMQGNHPSVGLVAGLVFVAAGLAFKVSAVPFHMWTPDVYEGAPTPITAFFAVAPKVAAVALFVRVLVGPFGEMVGEWRQIIYFCSVASMLLGSFAAINQHNIKRLMAYSSIGHIGYALVGLAAGTEEGVRGVLIYMAIYVFMNVGAFAVILSMRQKGRMVEEIADLGGLSRRQPMLAAAMAVFMFSMAGIPPMAGFFGKLYVFLAAIQAQLYVLAVLGVLTSVVGAFYYLRIIKVMYFDQPAPAFDGPVEFEVSAVLTVTGLFTLLFFVFPSPILSAAARAAAALVAG